MNRRPFQIEKWPVCSKLKGEHIMDYKTLSVKTFIEDMNGKEIMMKTVPSLTKYPLKLFYKKTVGDIVNLVRSKKLVPEDAIQAFIKDVEAL